MLELVLVRHAQPAWEPDGHAVDDPTLTELGWQQAERVAEALAGEHFDHVYCSPLQRARNTIAPLEARWGQAAGVQAWLEEIRLPSLAGEPQAKVYAYLKGLRDRRLEQWWDGMPGGESFRHFHERVVGGLRTHLDGEHEARLHGDPTSPTWIVPQGRKRFLMVAHCGTIAVMLSYLLGIEAVPWEWERFRLGWAGICRLETIEVGGGAIWTLQSFNTRDHLRGLSDPWG